MICIGDSATARAHKLITYDAPLCPVCELNRKLKTETGEHIRTTNKLLAVTRRIEALEAELVELDARFCRGSRASRPPARRQSVRASSPYSPDVCPSGHQTSIPAATSYRWLRRAPRNESFTEVLS